MCCALAVDNPQKKENPADRESLGLNGEAMNKKSGSSGMHDVTSVAGQLDAERDTQDDMLGELSTVISHMKEMSMDMNVEIQRYVLGLWPRFEVALQCADTLYVLHALESHC
jgi:synaptosomal-associated protein 25